MKIMKRNQNVTKIVGAVNATALYHLSKFAGGCNLASSSNKQTRDSSVPVYQPVIALATPLVLTELLNTIEPITLYSLPRQPLFYFNWVPNSILLGDCYSIIRGFQFFQKGFGESEFLTNPTHAQWLVNQMKIGLAEFNVAFKEPMPQEWIDSLTLQELVRWASLGYDYLADENAVPRLLIVTHFLKWGVNNLSNLDALL